MRSRLSQTQSPLAVAHKSDIRFFVRNFSFFANFGLSKIAVYATPIFIAAIAPAQVYGAIEFGWAIALFSATLVAGASLAGLNQRYLVLRDRVVGDELALITMAGAGLGVALGLGALMLGAPPEWAVALGSLGIAVFHNVASTFFRMRGDRNLTAWFDGTATIAAGLIIAGLWAAQASMTTADLALAYIVAAAAITLGSAAIFLSLRRPNLHDRMRRSFIIGSPILAGAVLAMWLGVGGRMIIGFLDASLVATYSLMFRVAGLALGIHQLATTMLFARLYAARTRDADRLLLPFLTGVGTLTGLIAFTAPPFVHHAGFEALQNGGEAGFRKALPIVCVQIFFWIAFAMLQLRINRAGLAARAIAPIAWITVGGALAIVVAARMFDFGLVGLCWGIAIQSAAYFWAEWAILARARLPHRRIGLCAAGFGVSLTAWALVNQMIQAST